MRSCTIAGASGFVSFEDWNERIQNNFERHFWVGAPGANEHDARPDLINKHCIYKDSVGASPPWTDYQLRPNFPVAMVVVSSITVTICLHEKNHDTIMCCRCHTIDCTVMTYTCKY